MKFNEDPVKL